MHFNNDSNGNICAFHWSPTFLISCQFTFLVYHFLNFLNSIQKLFDTLEVSNNCQILYLYTGKLTEEEGGRKKFSYPSFEKW